jgi:hypothetical protein
MEGSGIAMATAMGQRRGKVQAVMCKGMTKGMEGLKYGRGRSAPHPAVQRHRAGIWAVHLDWIVL